MRPRHISTVSRVHRHPMSGRARRLAAASLAAGMSCEELLELAKSRRRHRCALETTYTHANLAAYVSTCLPQFELAGPSDLPLDAVAVSSFPDAEPVDIGALATLLQTSEADAEDQLNGHCECCCVTLCDEVLSSISDGDAAPLTCAFRRIHARLAPLPWFDQARALFAPEVRARTVRAGERHTRAMWSHCLGVASDYECAPVVDAIAVAESEEGPSLVRTWCVGLAGVDERLRAVGERCVAAQSRIAVPLYILTYIFDGDELTDEELTIVKHETAQYSLHVAGLVVDGIGRRAYLADPNGRLLPGGNMEFIAHPLMPRGAPASTARSRFDLDQDAARKQPKRGRRK